MKNKVKDLSGQRYGMVVVTDEYFIKNKTNKGGDVE